MEKKLDLTLDVAKKFEKYLSVTPAEGDDTPVGESGDPGNPDEEF